MRARVRERGNVFFALFGAVALVGVLGAGIMSTMRGPLSTMVQVNLREQARAEMQVNLRLILASSSDQDTSPGDDLTEPLAPDISGCAAGSSAGQGCVPSSVGATINDPWGSAYRYCAWNLGPDNDAEGKWFAGGTSTNEIAVALISAGPDRSYDNDCAADPTYVTGTPLDDDIIIRMTYIDAISGSGGLWVPDDTTPTDPVATIDRSIDLTGPVSGGGALPSAQLRLGAASLLLPDHTVLGDGDCNVANDTLMRMDDSGSVPSLEICDGDNGVWLTARAAWSFNGSEIFYNADNVGIGNVDPAFLLDVSGTLNATGAVTFGGALDVTGATTLSSTLDVTGNTTVSGTFGVTGATTLSSTLAVASDTIITGSTDNNTADALTVSDSGSTAIFVVQNDGRVGINDANPSEELDVTGDINVSGTYLINGTVMLGTDNVSTNILLGPVTSPVPGTTANYLNLGDVVHADLVDRKSVV